MNDTIKKKGNFPIGVKAVSYTHLRVQLGALLDKLCGAWQKELDDAGEQEPPHRPHPGPHGPHGPHGPGPEMHEFHRHHDGCCKMERFMREAKRCDMDRE